MATKSFVTEFKFTTKSGQKFLKAVDRSKTRKHEIRQTVNVVNNPESAKGILDSFLGSRQA